MAKPRKSAFILSALTASLLTAIPANAAFQAAEKDRSTKETAEDVAMQPAEDLGLDKKEIPELLLEISEQPYTLKGMRTCSNIRNAVEALDEVLGSDLDVKGDKTREQKRKETAGEIGGAVVNSIIPFRGLIRQVSGAAKRERDYNNAIYAGVVRRSFLKGVGQQRGCKYPAAPQSVK